MTTPEQGVITDVESAIAHLTQPEEAKEEEVQEEAVEAEEAETEEAEAEEVEASDEDTADEEADEAEEAEEPRYTVKVDGEEFEVTLDELTAGYQKGADYHRKTAAVAEERRQLQAQAQQYEQAREQLAEQLARFAAQGEEKEPDWVELADKLDPWEYQRQRAAWDKSTGERRLAAQQAQQLQAERNNRILAQETHRLLESFPEWKDPQAFERERAAMLATAKDYGFTDQEFFSAVDHRVFKLLKDAMQGRKLKNPKPVHKVPKQATKTLKPGAKQTKGEKRAADQSALRDNLRKRGDTDSAVRFLLGG